MHLVALSVQQPWASRIVRGEKTLEVRSWPWTYRGPLAICASRRPVVADPRGGVLPAGVLVGLVRVTGCRPMQPRDERRAGCPYRPGHYVFVLDDAVELCGPGWPVRGQVRPFELHLPPSYPLHAVVARVLSAWRRDGPAPAVTDGA